MSSFKRTDVNIFSKKRQQTSESLFWRKFEDPSLLKEFGPIDYLDFSPIEPYNFAVTSSARVQIYNPVTKSPSKNLNKFKETAFGGSFRNDGRLLCAGSEDKMVRMFDVSNRNLLRRFKGHSRAVHRACFTSDKAHIASFSDDKTVILWDVVTEQQIVKYEEHSDYIRAGAVASSNPNIIISGAYDNLVKMYDTRDLKPICSLDHGAPVESCLFLPSDSLFITAGGKEIRIWDAFSRSCLTKCGQFHKTVTCICPFRNGKRLIAGSLDQRVKIFDLVSYKVVHTMTYTSPILSVACSKDDKTFVTGSVSGLVTIQKCGKSVEELTKKRVPFRYVSDTPAKGNDVVDTVVIPLKKDKLAKYDQALRKFQYSKALDCVMTNQMAFKMPAAVVTVFDELIRRKGLYHAVSERNSKELATILRFLVKYTCDVRYMNVLIEVTDCVIDAYCDSIDSFTSEVRKLFNLLYAATKREVQTTEELLKLQGALELIFASASFSSPQVLESSENESKTNIPR